jgi:CDP-glucose 4,6-dehydratase
VSVDFWVGKRVFLTGHTGFKGAWLALWLERLGAEVTGYALEPGTDPSLFDLLGPWRSLDSHMGNLEDRAGLESALRSSKPEIVIHMAAQALVRVSYKDPVETWSTNVVGTARLLDLARSLPGLSAVLVVTSDKVYENAGSARAFVESDRLGGRDPYSASKAAQELVTSSFAASYLDSEGVKVASARAGNVVGGGDLAPDRLVPDLVRAIAGGQVLRLRYPEATRPFQFVLDPLAGYLEYARGLTLGADLPPSLNFGPAHGSATTANVVQRLLTHFGVDPESGWAPDRMAEWPEQKALDLDSTAARAVLDWSPRIGLDETLSWTAAWYRAHRDGANMRDFSLQQIERFMAVDR